MMEYLVLVIGGGVIFLLLWAIMSEPEPISPYELAEWAREQYRSAGYTEDEIDKEMNWDREDSL